MKLIPLIGTLLISISPVQVSPTPGEIKKTCEASEKVLEACFGTGVYMSSITGFTLLCMLREAGEITPKVFAEIENRLGKGPEKEYERLCGMKGGKLYWKNIQIVHSNLFPSYRLQHHLFFQASSMKLSPLLCGHLL